MVHHTIAKLRHRLDLPSEKPENISDVVQRAQADLESVAAHIKSRSKVSSMSGQHGRQMPQLQFPEIPDLSSLQAASENYPLEPVKVDAEAAQRDVELAAQVGAPQLPKDLQIQTA